MKWETIVKVFRSFMNLTQEKFGALIGAGVTAACVCYWENGEKTPSLRSQAEISSLAENTGVDLQELKEHSEEILSREEKLKSVDIKAFREELGLNQTEFAEKLGISLAAVSYWESGERNPGEESIRRIKVLAAESGIELPFDAQAGKIPESEVKTDN